MNKPEMIGICGGTWENSAVGKTTVVNILAKKLGYYPISFMEPVREAAKKYFDWDGNMNSEAKVLLDRICRMGRTISEDYWMNLTLSRIPKEDNIKIVFDDLWFDNEVKMITSNGGIIFRVTKDGISSPTLPCEMIEISNNGSVADLQTRTLLIVSDALLS